MTVTNHIVAAVVTPRTRLSRRRNRASPDKPHARQDPERQAHGIKSDKGIWRLADGIQQQVGLQHRHACREGKQQRRAHPRSPAMLATVETDESGGGECQRQAQRDVVPAQSDQQRISSLKRKRKLDARAGLLGALP